MPAWSSGSGKSRGARFDAFYSGVAGGFQDPSDIAGLQLWLDASTLGLANGAAVATWTDLSDNTDDLTQGTAGSQPVFDTNVINSLPAVHFDGTADNVFCTPTFVPSGAQAATIFVVAKSDDSPVGNEVHWNYSQIAASPPLFTHQTTTNDISRSRWRNDANSNAVADNADPTVTNAHVYTTKFTTTAVLDYVDGGTPVSTAQSGATAVDTLTLGANRTTGTADTFFDGHLAEFIVYNSALADADRETVEAYLADKWV